METTTFVDEAGNTGYDIWSHEQPYFVMAAVTFCNDSMKKVGEYVHAMFESYREIDEHELKGYRWVKAGGGKAGAILEVLTYVKEHATDIHMIILEKKYMTAGLICQYFLDPEYSSVKNYYWTNDEEARIVAANYFYELLNEDEASKIAVSIMNPSVESLKESRDLLLEKVDNESIREIIVGTNDYLGEMASDIMSMGRDGLRRSVMMSPNYTTFVTLGSKVAMKMKEMRVLSNIVFDSARMCNEEFKSLFNLASSWDPANNKLLECLVGHTSWQGAFSSFSTANSKESVGVACADIVCSSIAQILKRKDAERLTMGEKGIWMFYKQLAEDNKIFWVASEQFRERIVYKIPTE